MLTDPGAHTRLPKIPARPVRPSRPAWQDGIDDLAPTVLIIGGFLTSPFFYRPMRARLMRRGAAAIVVNAFGAVTFQRSGFEKYYFLQTYAVPTFDGSSGTQSTTYPPD